MRCADRLDGLQPDKPSDPVLDMDNKIALGQACCLGNDIGPLGLAPRLAHQPVAENVLFADKGDILEFETVFDTKDAQRRGPGRELVSLLERADFLNRAKPVITQDLPEPVPGSVGPAGDDRPFAGSLKFAHMGRQGVENVDVTGGTFGRKTAALFAAQCDNRLSGSGRRRKRIERGTCPVRDRGSPLAFQKIEFFRCDRHIGHGPGTCPHLPCVLSRRVMLRYLFKPFPDRVGSVCVQNKRRVADIVEQRFKPLVKQRQPMLHARITPAVADRLVKHIFAARRTEHRKIGPAEA